MQLDMINSINNHKDFLFSLMDDSDWSLVIKSHALLESLVTELIVSKTEEDKLKNIIERLPMHDNQIGKLKIVKEYRLLDEARIKFIKWLSERRNDLVHKFENINFKFSDYVSSLDKNQKKSHKKIITWHTLNGSPQVIWEEASINKPKIAVWFSVFMLVVLICVDIEELKGFTKIKTLSEETIKRLLVHSV